MPPRSGRSILAADRSPRWTLRVYEDTRAREIVRRPAPGLRIEENALPANEGKVRGVRAMLTPRCGART